MPSWIRFYQFSADFFPCECDDNSQLDIVCYCVCVVLWLIFEIISHKLVSRHMKTKQRKTGKT